MTRVKLVSFGWKCVTGKCVLTWRTQSALLCGFSGVLDWTWDSDWNAQGRTLCPSGSAPFWRFRKVQRRACRTLTGVHRATRGVPPPTGQRRGLGEGLVRAQGREAGRRRSLARRSDRTLRLGLLAILY